MPQFDGDPAEAEADIRQATEAAQAAEGEYDLAMERLNDLDKELDSPDIEQRMNDADREASRLKQLFDEAEDEFQRTVQYWRDEGFEV